LQANEEHTFTVLGKCTFEPFWGKNIKCTRIRSGLCCCTIESIGNRPN
jgi:hypothetical protein